MRTLCNTFWAALCVVALGVPAARAQQQQTPDQQQQTPNQGAPPIPAYRSPLASASGNDDSDAQESTPDNRSLSGAQDLSPILLPTRSYWQPQVNVFGTVDSNPGARPGSTAWTGEAALSGHVDVHRMSGNSDMNLSYTAGGIFSGDSSFGNGTVQTLGFGDKFSFRRAEISIFDQLDLFAGSVFWVWRARRARWEFGFGKRLNRTRVGFRARPDDIGGSGPRPWELLCRGSRRTSDASLIAHVCRWLLSAAQFYQRPAELHESEFPRWLQLRVDSQRYNRSDLYF